MPTEEDNAVDQPTDLDNANDGTENDSALNAKLEEAKKRESDARKKMDESNLEAKRLKEENAKLKKLALGEEVEEETEDQPDYLTKAEFNNVVKFEISNEDSISLNQEGYDDYRSKGYSPQDSLRLAHLDKGITSDNMSDHLRQSQSSQGDSSVDRSDVKVVSPEKQAELKKWGISEETYLDNKNTVEGR